MFLITVSNRYYSLVLDENAGKIISFFTKRGNLLSGIQPPLFTVRLRDEKGEKLEFSAIDSKNCSVKQNSSFCEMKFGDFTDKRLSVKVILNYSKDSPFIKWRVEVDCDSQIEWIEFPGLAIEDDFKEKGGNSKILWPYNEGVLVDSIADRMQHFAFKEPEYPSCGNYGMCPGMVSTPFIALLSRKGGLYLGAHDKKQNTHFVDFAPFEDGVRLYMRIYPGTAGGNYLSDYDTVMGIFEGDWYEAAEIYRSWFEKEKSKDFTPIKDNKNLPEWYSQSPVVVTYCVRGHHDTDVMTPNAMFPYINGLPIIEDIAQRLNSRILVLLMHWEGTAPWAPPYVWPPYGGEEELKKYIDALHAKGHLLGVYCSGLGWTQISNLTDYRMDAVFDDSGLGRVMCSSPNGTLPLSNICTAQRLGYDMCPAVEFTKKTLVSETEKMINSNIDYIQLFDQNHGGTPYFCYSKEHGHPAVPGRWQSEAVLEIMNRIKKININHKTIFGCESAASEVFIPEMLLNDNRFELNYMFGLPVPLYSYLYHEYINNFMGNQVIAEGVFKECITKNNLLYRMAYSFTAGDFLTIVINDEGKPQWAWGQSDFNPDHMPDEEKVYTLAKNMNLWRKSWALKYLHEGKMLKPIELCGISETEMETVSGMKYVMPLQTARYVSSDGDIGQIIVNFTEEALTFKINSSDSLLYRNPDNNGEKIEGEVTIEPLEVILIESKNI